MTYHCILFYMATTLQPALWNYLRTDSGFYLFIYSNIARSLLCSSSLCSSHHRHTWARGLINALHCCLILYVLVNFSQRCMVCRFCTGDATLPADQSYTYLSVDDAKDLRYRKVLTLNFCYCIWTQNTCTRLVHIASRDVDKYILLPVNSSHSQQWSEMLTGNSKVVK